MKFQCVSTSNNPNGVMLEIKVLKLREMVRRFHMKLNLFIFARENSFHPPQVFLNEALYLKTPGILVFFSIEFYSRCYKSPLVYLS